MPIRFTRRRLLEAAAVGTAHASGLAAEQNRSFADAGHVRGSVRPYEVVVADVDTTGLDPIEDRIVTVALLKADLGDSSAEEGLLNAQRLHVKVDPGVPISAGASNVHGIYDDDVRGRKRFSEAAPNIRNFIGDLPLIGHNVEFDRTFLSSELRRAGADSLDRNRTLCTMGRLRELRSGNGQGRYNSSLTATAKLLHVEGRSGAKRRPLEDAMIILEIARKFYAYDCGALDIETIPGSRPRRAVPAAQRAGGASDESLADNRRIAVGAEAGGNRGDGADPPGR